MLGNQARGDLQRRLEQGDNRQEVVVLSLTLLGVAPHGAAADGPVQPALEAALRQAVAAEAGPGIGPEHVALAFSCAESAVAPEAMMLGREEHWEGVQEPGGWQGGYDAEDGTSNVQEGWEAMKLGLASGAEDSQFVEVVQGVTVAVSCIVTPPGGLNAGGVATMLTARATEAGPGAASPLAERVAGALGAVEGLQAMPDQALQVIDITRSEVRLAIYPECHLDKRHGIPSRVFAFYADFQVLDDARIVVAEAVAPLALQLDTQEVEWALQKCAEVFRDPALERLFVLTVGGLLRQDRRCCHRWAASAPPKLVRHILLDSPVMRKICSKSSGVYEQQAHLQRYIAECKLCVALAVVAGDVQKRWIDDLTAEDKAFLKDAAEALSGLAGLTVTMARSLWDRSACRFLIIDRLAQEPAAAGPEAALRHLRSSPKDVLTSRFAAPWREGPCKEASFFYLHQSFASRRDCGAAEDLMDLLAEAYGMQPSADLPGTLKAFMEDSAVPDELRRDLFVAFVSACRCPGESRAETARRCICFRKPPAPALPEARPMPSTEGVELVALEAILRTYASREASIGQWVHDGTCSQFAEMLEAVLLLSSGDSLWSWSQAKSHEDPSMAEHARRLLNMTAWWHFSDIVLRAAASMRTSWYDDARARELVDGARPWAYHAGKAGRFSQYARGAGLRRTEDFSQLFWMYFKLDLALGAGSIWNFIQTLEEGSTCMANRFNRLAPVGSTLRMMMARDVQRACSGCTLEVKRIDALMSYYGFFSPSFQGLLGHEAALADAQAQLLAGCAGAQEADSMLAALLEATVRLISFGGGGEGPSAQETISSICEQCCTHPVPLRLFRKVLDAVRRLERPAGGDFGLPQLGDCARELGKAGRVLADKLERRGAPKSLLGGVERTIDALLAGGAPSSWASSFRSLDTVIFALEYMEKEDLQLAFDQFEAECRSQQSEQLQELLECVRKIYREPLAAACREGLAPHVRIVDAIKRSAPPLERRVTWRGAAFDPADWQRVLEIAGAAAEAMRQRYNVLMLPHHTQMIALLMFAVRACGARSSGVGARKLPKTMIARVGTGEGKSLIIAMLAAFVAKRGLRAHVINDNRVLADRDFAASQPLFAALGVRASSDRGDLKNKDCKIVYCTGDDVEKSCLDNLIEGQVEAYEEGLQEAVLIVDEVDGLIFDKGTVSNQVFEDREFSEWINEWLLQLETKGEVQRDWDDFRSHGECSLAIQKEVEQAYEEMFQKQEGVDYVKRGDLLYMVDAKTNLIKQDAWSLWLEALKRHRADGSYWVKYKYVKAILCRIQCFMSYSTIFGLTGSLGQNAEKHYLRDHYEATPFNVPFFLDTCRAEPVAGRPTSGDRVTVVAENSEALMEVDRVGTRGLVGVIAEDRPDEQWYRVELGDGRSLWYKEQWVAKGGFQGRRPPTLVGDCEPLPNREEQERAVVTLATHKCVEVPVLVLVKDSETVQRVAGLLRQRLRELYWGIGGEQAGDGAGGDRDAASSLCVIELLHNPADPQQFVRLVELATEPVPIGGLLGACGGPLAAAAGQEALGEQPGPGQLWRVTVSTAEGGRGHDYRVLDPTIDDKGGLLLILTWVPWSEREWIQFLGRTGRQDHAGQYAVFLDAEEEQLQGGMQERQPGESPAQAIMRHGDSQTAMLLQGKGDEIVKGRLMHRLTSRYWSLHKMQRTTKRQDWEWKRLCENYAETTADGIQQTFCNVIVPPKELVLGFAKLINTGPPRKGLAEQTCGKCGTMNIFPEPSAGQPWPTVRCGHCAALSDERPPA